MSPRRAAVALAIALAGAATPARADTIDDEHACTRVREPGLAEGPVVLGLYDADFATARRACLRSELAVYERFGAVIDTPNFYGGVRADTIVAGSFRLRPYLEVFGALELVHWEFAQNATIKASAGGLGQLTLGVQGLVYQSRRFAVSVNGRVLIPTATWSPTVQTAGADVGVDALFRPRRDVELHGQLTVDVLGGLSAGPGDVRGGTTLMLGVQYAPARWFAFAIDAAVVLGHRAALDAFLPQLALRFRLWRGLNLELDATAPVGGADRRLVIGALRLSYRF
jgi:hypothetical protein